MRIRSKDENKSIIYQFFSLLLFMLLFLLKQVLKTNKHIKSLTQRSKPIKCCEDWPLDWPKSQLKKPISSVVFQNKNGTVHGGDP